MDRCYGCIHVWKEVLAEVVHQKCYLAILDGVGPVGTLEHVPDACKLWSAQKDRLPASVVAGSIRGPVVRRPRTLQDEAKTFPSTTFDFPPLVNGARVAIGPQRCAAYDFHSP